MKNYKIIFFSLILVLAFIFIACDDNNNQEQTITIAFDNNDDEDEYIENSIILNEGDITVYQGKGVSDSEFYNLIEILNELVSTESLLPFQINNFKINFPEIRIISGNGISHNGTVLTIGCKENGGNIYKYLLIDNSLL